MSFDPSNPEHELENEQLLLQILRELKLLNLYIKEMTGFDFNKGDLDE